MGDDSRPVAAAAGGEHHPGAAPSDPDVLASIAAEAGIRRIHFVAWRDLDDPEAGGSELHAHRVASLWAAAGLDVTFRTSAVPGAPRALTRDGYRVVRRAGRYAVFPGAAWEGIRMGHRPGDALVEIWNGMPFLSPLWYRGPRIVFLHHVHAEMWGMVLPSLLARLGNAVESRVAPPIYRSSRIVAPSESSRAEIIDLLGLRPERITVASPGVDARYSPAGQRSPTPLVVAVGRLVPVKRFHVLLRALAKVKAEQPELRAVLIGEGSERTALEALREDLGAAEWVSMPGRVDDEELLSWYRRAWVVASSSQREGWGMTLTEAAACGTPAVATAIAGHADAVLDGESGLLVEDPAELSVALGRVLGDEVLRSRLSKGALARARWFTWDVTARRTLEALAGEAAAPA
ncbi:MAG: glycosyltransferase family 4 protein [Acidimicrobiales bacterium]|jgi:glycosyltransferase involved in cell wall biosynthesis